MAKSKRVQFVCPTYLWKYLDQQAAKFSGGNRSEYLRYLVVQDMRIGRAMPNRPQTLTMTRILREREIETTMHVGGYGSDHTTVLNELKTNPLFQKCQAKAE